MDIAAALFREERNALAFLGPSFVARISAKRPRAPATTVEDYYRTQMFYDDGARKTQIFCNAAPLFIRRSNHVRCARRLSWYAVSSGPYSCCKTQHMEEFGSAQRITKNTISNMGSSIFQMVDLRSSLACANFIRRYPNAWKAFATIRYSIHLFFDPGRRPADRVRNALPSCSRRADNQG
jgi:hypothetical protein